MKELDKILNRYARHASNGNTRQMNKARADLIDYMGRFVAWAELPYEETWDDFTFPDWIQKRTFLGEPTRESFVYRDAYVAGAHNTQDSIAEQMVEAHLAKNTTA